MTDTLNCPHCGRPVTHPGLGGLCPECLLQAGAPTRDGTEALGPHGTVVRPGKPTTPPAPTQIAAHFPQLEVLEYLGRGGMGLVYKARQTRLNRLVALKVLAPEKERDAQFAERFLREAQALARLSHANIVTVYDFGKADGLFYLLMEFVDGVNLRQLLQARQMPPEQALGIVPKICDALQYAHEQGIVHRDIKPENILLDKQGRVKIADFGIAKMLGDAAAPSPAPGASLAASEAAVSPGGLTQSQVVGTPQYMAPEQMTHPQGVDHRADIYSLGVVFYEMLTGELPVGQFALPSRKAALDTRLDPVVLHALEKEPDRRYQHASEVKSDVETIAQGVPPVVAPPRIAGEGLTAPTLTGWQKFRLRRWPPLVGTRNGLRVINWPAVGMRGLRGLLVLFMGILPVTLDLTSAAPAPKALFLVPVALATGLGGGN